jgi:hypothetical protein
MSKSLPREMTAALKRHDSPMTTHRGRGRSPMRQPGDGAMPPLAGIRV